MTIFDLSIISGAGDPDPAAGRPLPAHPDRPQQVGVPGGLHRVPDHPGYRALIPGTAITQLRKQGVIYNPA